MPQKYCSCFSFLLAAPSLSIEVLSNHGEFHVLED
jgi:hypothetical protein